MNVLADRFSDLSDPREDGKVIYPLTDILVIAVCAAIAGAESYEDIVLYGKSKTSWLSEFLELEYGIPSHDTFRRVFSLIDAEAFEACFTEWAESQAESSPDGEVVAIDGKTIRRSFDHGKEQSPLHVVSAWASEQSLALAQEVVEEKSNEITAIPEVLDALQLEGALVTIDAMGCQINIAEQILEEKADYLLALKANHETAYRAVQAHFEDRCFGSGAFEHGAESRLRSDGFDDSHGRVVRRRVFACEEAAGLEALSEWSGLQSVVGIETIRTVKGESETNAEIRYFLSSREADDEALEDAARRHWSIENSLHWVLDVTFNEDQSRVRDETAASNWAVLRKMALNLLKSDSEADTSIKGRRKQAGWDNDYMRKLLHGNLIR
jgi:predicted transposase YbfD/YdcC